STTGPSGSCTSSAHTRNHGQPSATSRRDRVSQFWSDDVLTLASAGLSLASPGLEAANIFGHMDGAMRSQLLLHTPGELRPRIAVEGRGNACGEKIRDERLGLRDDQG